LLLPTWGSADSRCLQDAAHFLSCIARPDHNVAASRSSSLNSFFYLSHNTAVYLDVEDVVYTVGDLFSGESADQIFAFTNANEIQDLLDHIKGVIQVSHIDNYGVMIFQSMTVGFWSRAMAFVPLLIATSI